MYEHFEMHCLIAAGVAGKGPVRIIRRLIADPDVSVRSVAPVIDREQRLSRVVIMDLH